ncbi:hypothetical protein V2J09_011527 [Rumex salicifolius]
MHSRERTRRYLVHRLQTHRLCCRRLPCRLKHLPLTAKSCRRSHQLRRIPLRSELREASAWYRRGGNSFQASNLFFEFRFLQGFKHPQLIMPKRLNKARGLKRFKRPEKGSKQKKYEKDNVVRKQYDDSTEEDIHDGKPSISSSDEDEETEEELVHKESSIYGKLLEKLEHSCDSRVATHKKRKNEAKQLRNGEEDRDDKQEAFHLLNKCDHLEGIKYKSGNEDKGGTVDASLSDDGDESDDASEDSDDGLLLADDVGCATVVSSGANSSFTRHVTRVLSEHDIENLSRRKWRYQWEVPAFDSSTWKWKGTGDCLLKDAEPIMSYGLKQKLYKHWLDIYKASGGNDFHSSKQRIFFSLCSSYRDILHHNKKPFYLKGLQEDSSMMDAYIMHSLNHVFKCRDVVMKNEARLAKNNETGKDEVLTNNIYLDRGFCRPKVLILLPLASIALRVVKKLIQLTPSGNKVNVQYMDRFTNEFGVANNENVDDDLPLANGAEIENMMPQKPTKPSDFEALFGGNNNDHFMVGIKFTRKSIKLYGDFYTSDLIVASPLGLITKIGEAEVDKNKDVDYLSSIEILVIDHADVITMQNWSHVSTVLQHLNQLPSKNHGDDIMRVRQWYLDGQAQFYRQSIILSSYLTPEINALFNQQCANYEGKLTLSCEHKGILPKVVLQVRQIYERFPVDSLVDADDARFEYFIKKIFPKIKDTIQGGIMIFISSYFEFVRVRNFLKSQDSSFCLLGEYTKQSDISRARVWFFQGTRQIMLYTERAHFYHRYKIRGIKNLIIYSLPERKEFYPELVNMLQESHDMSCTVLFSRFDQFRLERIVGNTAAKRLVTSEKDLFLFC